MVNPQGWRITSPASLFVVVENFGYLLYAYTIKAKEGMTVLEIKGFDTAVNEWRQFNQDPKCWPRIFLNCETAEAWCEPNCNDSDPFEPSTLYIDRPEISEVFGNLADCGALCGGLPQPMYLDEYALKMTCYVYIGRWRKWDLNDYKMLDLKWY